MRQAETETIVLQTADCDIGPKSCADVTVYFDGSCPLCSVEIRHYASRSGAERLRFVDVSQPDAAVGPELTAGDAMRRFHVRNSDGTLLSGARAFVAIWQTLPGWRLAARIASLPGVTAILEIGYRLFLPIRPALSWVAVRLGAKAGRGRNTD